MARRPLTVPALLRRVIWPHPLAARAGYGQITTCEPPDCDRSHSVPHRLPPTLRASLLVAWSHSQANRVTMADAGQHTSEEAFMRLALAEVRSAAAEMADAATGRQPAPAAPAPRDWSLGGARPGSSRSSCRMRYRERRLCHCQRLQLDQRDLRRACDGRKALRVASADALRRRRRATPSWWLSTRFSRAMRSQPTTLPTASCPCACMPPRPHAVSRAPRIGPAT